MNLKVVLDIIKLKSLESQQSICPVQKDLRTRRGHFTDYFLSPYEWDKYSVDFLEILVRKHTTKPLAKVKSGQVTREKLELITQENSFTFSGRQKKF